MTELAATQHPAHKSRPAPGAFVARTVTGITGALERNVFSVENARLPGVLQQTDPRVKLVSILILLAATSLARHLLVVIAVYLASLLLARLSRLHLPTFARGVWLGIPLLGAVVAIPSLFLLPGHTLIATPEFGGMRLAVTDSGVSSAAMLLSRVGTSVSLGALLILTTRWADLLKALQVLRVPDVFIVVLGITYRYLFLLLHTTNNMFLSRTSRTVGQTSGFEQRRWIGALTGTLVGKSLKMSDDVYQAMLSRGFAGEIRTFASFRARDQDRLFLGLAAVFAAGILLVDRSMM